MESDQGTGKRSASPDDHQDNKRLKPDGVNSKSESLDDWSDDDFDDYDLDEITSDLAKTESKPKSTDYLLSDDDDEEDDYDFELDGISYDNASTSSLLTPNQIQSITTTPNTTYDVLSPQEIEMQMEQRIENATGVLQLPPTTVRALLNHCNWNKEKLLDAYFGGGDAKKLFKDAGIDSPSSQEIQRGPPSSNGGKEECLICFFETDSSDMIGMNCGHKFCKECWKATLKSQIIEQENGAKFTCIAHNCSTLVKDDMIRRLITEKEVLKKFNELLVSSFVQTNPSYKWCPGPDCTKAIKTRIVNKMNPQVKCECGHSFCFECSGDAHAPITCEQLRKWLIKYELDDGNGSWLLSNTKPCPKCKANIQKNGGCNHMNCKKCKHHFCWDCLQPLEGHSGSKCNQFAGNEAASKLRNTETFNLEQFVFYSSRYRSQQDSLKIERQLLTKIQEKVADLIQSLTDMDFLKEAIDVLCECRQTLQFTYVFAYYVEKCNQVDIFVGNQNDLQDAVEKLSGFLEEDKDGKSLMAAKMRVRDLSNYCRARRQVLIDHVVEGHEKMDEKCGWKFKE